MTIPAGTPAVPRSSKARWLAAAFAVLLCLGFIGLGTWQIFRLQWKLDLIAAVGQRVHASAVAAPAQADWAAVSKQADEYRHVSVHGRWLEGADTLVQATTNLGSGFWLLSPLCRDDGSIVLVNRGFVTPQRPRPVVSASPACTTGAGAGEVSVTGLLRLSEPGGGFLRDNDPRADRWFSRDIAAIAAKRRLAPLAPVAPYFIDREASATPPAPDQPVGGLTVLSFTNNHLVYALTWFGMAAMSLFALWLLLRRGAR